ncbi:MAG: histidine--tRNA ligase [bacterium]
MGIDRSALTPPPGMRDWLPPFQSLRREVEEILRGIALSYGFVELSTPSMERKEVLGGKYGEEGEKLSFWVLKRGAELSRVLKASSHPLPHHLELADYGLRYDLTVPLARLVANYYRQWVLPFKRYQFGSVWRAERPQHGRFREFTQCDADIVGSSSPLADAEILSLFLDGFEALRQKFNAPELQVTLRLNHRGLLLGLMGSLMATEPQFSDFCQALDKWDKVGAEGVSEELIRRGFEASRTREFISILTQYLSEGVGRDPEGAIDKLAQRKIPLEVGEVGQRAMENLRAILNALQRQFGQELSSVMLDITLARGLDYYTGAVFEVVGKEASVGSLGGGGRYDHLIGKFSGEEIPAVGGSFGLERIVEILSQKPVGVLKGQPRIVIIELEPENLPASLSGALRKALINAGMQVEIDYDLGGKLTRRLSRADRSGAHFVLLVGSSEREIFLKWQQTYRSLEKALPEVPIPIKRLQDGVQRSLTLPQLVAWVKESRG